MIGNSLKKLPELVFTRAAGKNQLTGWKKPAEIWKESTIFLESWNQG